MKHLPTILTTAVIAWQNMAGSALAADSDVVVIANVSVPTVDAQLLSRLYTGRAVEAGNVRVTVVNAAVGSNVRDQFLNRVLQQDDEKYRAYWLVRRHVGKGIPPKEFQSASEMIDYVLNTPGAIGYVRANEVTSGVRVILKP